MMTADLDGLWDFGDPAASEERFREALSEAALEDVSFRVEALTQLARAQGLQRRFDEARRTLDEAEIALRGDPSARPRVRLLLERGRVANSSGRKADALPLFVCAWDLARECAEDGLAVDAAHMVAIAEEGDRIMAWNRKAMELAESSRDPRARKWRGSLLNNMGWTLHAEKRYEEALDHFHRALAAREEQGHAGNIRIARWCVARCLRSLDRIPEALAMQESLELEAAAANAPDGFVQEELGECLITLGRAGEAHTHFAKAYELLSQDAWFVANEPARLERMKSFGG